MPKRSQAMIAVQEKMKAQGGDLTVWMYAAYKQGWRAQKIAVFLASITGIPISVSVVRAWCVENIPEWEEETNG